MIFKNKKNNTIWALIGFFAVIIVSFLGLGEWIGLYLVAYFFIIPIAIIIFILFIKAKQVVTENNVANASVISKANINTNTVVVNQMNTCSKCGNVLKVGHLFCENCGTKVMVTPQTQTASQTQSNMQQASNQKQANTSAKNKVMLASDGVTFNPNDYPLYNYDTENKMLKAVVKAELNKNYSTKKMSLNDLEKKKTIFTIVYSLILLICASLFFFHVGTTIVIIIFIVATIVYFVIASKYNLVTYLMKEVVKRPDEKISYVIASMLSNGTVNSSYKLIRLAILAVAVIVPLFLFRTPNVIYERQGEDYVVRFYTIGWMENDKVLEIPSEYNGKKVVGIRGDVFANVKTIEEVILPDSITEIRGGAFKNAVNLKKIKLPNKITDIKGNTFEGCVRLEEITIPDSVIRIGGHAFRSDSLLGKVNISSKSQLKEIGSSAFRDCTSLKKIYLPRGVNINERSFKNSPTKIIEYTESGIILEEEYLYYDSIYLKVGEERTINEYKKNSKVHKSTIILIGITGKKGDYKYKFRYTFEGRSVEFTLDKDNQYYIINDDIAIEISSNYTYNYYSASFLIKTYTN